MANINVVNLGREEGRLSSSWPMKCFAGQVNDALLWEAVKHYRAALRQGTAATKNRKLVAGSGKKLWKQKGTGRARVGSVRSPLWRQAERSTDLSRAATTMPSRKKKLLGALRSALAAKLADGKLTVVDTLELKEAKTKLYPPGAEQARGGNARRCWSRTARRSSQALMLGARNLKGVELVLSNEVHPYDLLRYERAIFSKAAIERCRRR